MLATLREIGLTESESKVYLALLKLGEATVGPIADESGAAYSKVYLLLEKLIDKGLVTHITKKKTRYFSATNPRRLLELVEKKATIVNKQRDEIAALLPGLEKQFQRAKEIERAEVYEGYEGLNTIYSLSLEEMKPRSEILVIGGSMGVYTNPELYRMFFARMDKKRQAKKIIHKVIYNEGLRNEPGIKAWQKLPDTHAKFLFQKTPGSVNIQGNRVLIIYWREDGPKVFAITSSTVAGSFRQYFEALWMQAKA